MNKKLNSNDDTKFCVSKIDKVFALVKDEKEKVHICMAGKAVSRKTFDTFEQADKYLATKPYEIFINIAFIIKNLKENETETNQKQTEENA